MSDRESLEDRLARDDAAFAELNPVVIQAMAASDASHVYKPELFERHEVYRIAPIKNDIEVLTAERALRERVEMTREEPTAYEEHLDAVEASRRVSLLVDEALHRMIDQSTDTQASE